MVRRRIVGVAVLSTLVLASLAAGSAQAEVIFDHAFGGTGTGAGQFSTIEYGPGGISVNESNGHVFVADPGNHRVQEFTADGTFVSMFGQAVDQTSGGDICTAASGHVCQAGAVGGTGGAFNRPQGVVANSATGDIYVQDANNRRIQKFNAAG